jgi:DNA-binding response OmpR family regulator
MDLTLASRVSGSVRGGLPLRMKVLYITTLSRTGGWLAEAFAADSASKMVLQEVVGSTAGLSRLRDEVFDVVLVSHEPDALNALDLIEGMRAGGNEEPMIVLGTAPAQSIDALCYEVGADDYCCVAETTVRGLLWKFARAIGRHQLVRENRRLLQAERQRLQQEHHEAERLLEQQRVLIADLDVLHEEVSPHQDDVRPSTPVGTSLAGLASSENSSTLLELPEPLINHYRDLLRTYVIMGAGNLSDEMASLARLLATSGISAQRTMQLHVQVLEELVRGLGNRSARHVMSRADLLVLEVMGHLADSYRQRYHERRWPPRQLRLPGFEDSHETGWAVGEVAADNAGSFPANTNTNANIQGREEDGPRDTANQSHGDCELSNRMAA